ncbi:MAG: CbbQ/NirQ/NorQ/GpvN family protein [Thaumarchaeota archaeon]|nr:CbbQ/NirQ/NorQ/GpvN family protein [Nitrososphaerota archaeon]MCL5318378.1 CbbQ/NirQ/NorQ/GpvN family protein [Nitrososphaerota archaeon]
MSSGDEGKKRTMQYVKQGDVKGHIRKDVDLVKTEIGDTTLYISTARPRIKKSRLVERYNVEKYDLSMGYNCPDFALELMPSDTPEYIDQGENYVQRIVRALAYFKQCALVGPSGTGKTHIVYLVAELAGLPLWEINCGLQTSSYDLFGRYIGLGKENWVDGQIVSWCRYGGILYLDEANMMKQDVATRLNPVLDTRGHIVLTEKDNEIIPRHPRGYVIISMNPYSSEFAGTKPLNAAFRRRMTVWINFDYLSIGDKVAQEEVAMIGNKAGVSPDVALKITKVGAELRRQYKTGDIPYGPSVGDLINWARLISDGMTPKQSAEEAIVALTSDDSEVQSAVRRIVAMFFGSD